MSNSTGLGGVELQAPPFVWKAIDDASLQAYKIDIASDVYVWNTRLFQGDIGYGDFEHPSVVLQMHVPYLSRCSSIR